MAQRTFGKYALVNRIGIGGMAEVFEGRLDGAAGFSKRLAIKLLLPELQSEPRVVDMFIDEATIAAGLTHPNIVHVFDFGEIDGSYFMAMEYVDGWDLRKLCTWSRQSGQRYPVAAAARIVAQLCRALDYIHQTERQIVHRDVTPHNVFVTRHGAVKLGDFGIARAEARRSRTEDGQIKGKLAYLAPEQVRGDPVVVQTDVYAAGLVLYELLAGQPLLAADRDVDLLKVALNPPEAALAGIRPDASPLEATVKRALRANIMLRYPTAALMAQELERFLATSPFGADDLARFASDLAAKKDVSIAAPRHQPRHRHRRHLRIAEKVSAAQRATTQLGAGAPKARPAPWRLALIASGLAIGAVVAVVAIWNEAPAPRPTPAASASNSAPDASTAGRPVDLAAVLSSARDLQDDDGRAAGDATATTAPPDRGLREPRQRHRRRLIRPRRRPKKLAKAQPPSMPPAPPPTKKPKVVESAAAAPAVKQQLTSLLQRGRSKGLWPGDGPLTQNTLSQLRQDLDRKRINRATATLQRLERSVDAFRIDRRFVERKLQRLEARIKRSNPTKAQRQQLTALSQRILGLIMDRRLVEASRLISRAMTRLASKSGR